MVQGNGSGSGGGGIGGSRQQASSGSGAGGRALSAVRRHPLRAALSVVTLLLVCVVAVGGWYAWTLERDYRETRAHVDAAKEVLSPASGEQFAFTDLPTVLAELDEVDAGLREMQGRLDIPIISPIARKMPIVGPKMKAIEQLVAFGLSTTQLARDGAQLTHDVYAAYAETGLTGPVDPASPTWLTVVQENRDLIDDLLVRFDALLVERDNIDVANLPGRGRNSLASIDSMLNSAGDARSEYGGFVAYFPIVEQALAVNRDGRYLVMLNNSNEIRPSGGFPGTYAIVSISNGRLQDYSFHVIGEFDAAYADNRTTVLPAPSPIDTYLLQDHLLPRDAGWSPDFTENAKLWLEMWQIAGFPAVDGVIAVSDQAVESIFAVLGPMTVEIEGAPVTITGDTVIDVIESYRDGPGNVHKEAVRIIGTALLEQIKGAGLGNQRAILDNIQASADHREIQIYSTNADVQAEVVTRGWDGALYPQPDVPTFALTLANVIGNKASANIQVSADLKLTTQVDGRIGVEATLLLKNDGDPRGPQFYDGFHRTWLSVWLPPGAVLASTTPATDSPPMEDDARALGFHVPLMTQESKTIVVTFTLPAGSEELLLRRQSGANDVRVRLNGTGTGGSCTYDQRYWLDDDAVINLNTCTSSKVHAD